MAHAYTKHGLHNIVLPRKRTFFADILVFFSLFLILYFIVILATQWHSPISQKFTINLSPTALPYYAVLSTGRMAIAYVISLVFSFTFARFAVRNKRAEGIMLPILDVLQSIPILSFMPGLVLGLVALFPHSNLGLELAAVILIFTSQAWNITFGFYQTLLTIPEELKEVAWINRLCFWQKFTRLEVPAGMISLMWNSMMGWAQGWFFLMASEQFTLGPRSFQLPGLGSYLQTAANKGNISALVFGLGTLIVVIILLDQLLWRPLVAFGDRFKLEQDEADEKPNSWFLSLLMKSNMLSVLKKLFFIPFWTMIDSFLSKFGTVQVTVENIKPKKEIIPLKKILSIGFVILLLALLLFGIVVTFNLLKQINSHEWSMIFTGSFVSFLRVMAALFISLAWTVPVGVAIGLSPKWSKRMQPFVQIAASVPATAVFPAILLFLLVLPSGLNIAAIILMLMGTQWFILFNVIAGTMSIPNDLREATAVYKITGFNKWRYLILPSIFPYLVTGMITATGNAWNTTIVSEYVTFNGMVHQTIGLGAIIASAANSNNFRLLFAATVTMAVLVSVLNRFFWQRIYRLAENKYHFE